MAQTPDIGSHAIASLARQRGLRNLQLAYCQWQRPLWRVVQALPRLGALMPEHTSGMSGRSMHP